MPAVDFIHGSVKSALAKSGWTITDDPFTIPFAEVVLFADLGAERPIGAFRGDERIVVEAKSFRGRSAMHEFETALGQYLIYRVYMQTIAPERKVYLAISDRVYQGFFQQRAIQAVLQEYGVRLLVVDLEREEIVEWTS